MDSKYDELMKRLESLAAEKMASESEDFCAADWGGGNFDDTYALGVRDGEISLAAEVVAVLKETAK